MILTRITPRARAAQNVESTLTVGRNHFIDSSSDFELDLGHPLGLEVCEYRNMGVARLKLRCEGMTEEVTYYFFVRFS
jgi:hypothetical protein